MIRRTLREWQRIGYGDDDTTIPPAEADRIAAMAARSSFAGRGGEGVLEHGRKGLRARGVVGVIAAPGCQLEILPKIEGLGSAGACFASALSRRFDSPDYRRWRGRTRRARLAARRFFQSAARGGCRPGGG